MRKFWEEPDFLFIPMRGVTISLFSKIFLLFEKSSNAVMETDAGCDRAPNATVTNYFDWGAPKFSAAFNL